jgi:probable HAF family extracellular repeat protein
MSDLGTLGGTTSEAVAINSVGQVVGVAAVGTSAATDAFIWQGGVMTDLGLGDQSAPSGINDSGQVAVNANSRAMVWQNGSATDLGALGSSGASAADINNAGQIVGTSQTGATGGFGLPVSHAFVWQNGAMTDVGTPPGTLANYPASINSTGKIAGSYSIILNTGYGAAVIARPVVMDGGTMTYLPTPSNATSLAADINSSGTVVGYNGYGAFIFDHGTLTDLNTLIPPMPGVRLAGATAINDLGQIVGWTSGSQSHAFLLTPNIKAIPMNPDSIARLSAPRMSLDVLMANGGSSVLS